MWIKKLPGWKGALTVTAAVAANALVVTNFTGLSYAQNGMMGMLADYNVDMVIVPIPLKNETAQGSEMDSMGESGLMEEFDSM